MKKLLISLALIIVLAACSGNDINHADKITSPSTSKEIVSTESPPAKSMESLGITTVNFKERFNKYAEDFNSTYRIVGITTHEDTKELDYFRYEFDENVNMAANVNKIDGTISKMLLLAELDDNPKTIVDIITAMGIFIATTTDLSKDERGVVLEELGMLDENISEINKETTRNGINYHLKYNSSGFILTISDEIWPK